MVTFINQNYFVNNKLGDKKMNYKLRDQIKTILQECYNVDMASDRGREYIADMLVSNMSDDDDSGELKFRNYNGELNQLPDRVVENKDDREELDKQIYEQQKKQREELEKIKQKNAELEHARARRVERRKREENDMSVEKKKMIEREARQDIMMKNQHLVEEREIKESPQSSETVVSQPPTPSQPQKQVTEGPRPTGDNVSTGMTITDDMTPEMKERAERINKMIDDRNKKSTENVKGVKRNLPNKKKPVKRTPNRTPKNTTLGDGKKSSFKNLGKKKPNRAD